jgi:SAM-dependent methyltransferase
MNTTLSHPAQDEVNRAVYYSPHVYLYYLSKSLIPVESTFFSKYEPHWLGRDILDVGVGPGRTSRYLAPKARQYEAIDYSPVMVNHFRKTLPHISIHQADYRRLRMFADASFDLVFATANVIDALAHDDRLSALRETSRVLRPNGLFAFSTHNIHYRDAFTGPHFRKSGNPVKLAMNSVTYLLGTWNHRRLAPLRTQTEEYALLNDTGHFYSCLHYYVARDVVARQLAAAGMNLIEVLDGRANTLSETDDDSSEPWLFYVAQRETLAPTS